MVVVDVLESGRRVSEHPLSPQADQDVVSGVTRTRNWLVGPLTTCSMSAPPASE
jgi:hypothetical protein